MNVRIVLACAAFFTFLLNGPLVASAQGVQPQTFKVIGTWSNVSAWQNYEQPFWTKWLPEASGGKLKGNAVSITDAGLKGYEVIRLLKLGVFDFADGLIGYVSEGNGLIEGGDLAGMAQDFGTLHKIVDAYGPVLDQTFRQTFGAKIVALYPWPPSLLFCTQPLSGLGDLKGRKIRIHSASLGDYVEGLGARALPFLWERFFPPCRRALLTARSLTP